MITSEIFCARLHKHSPEILSEWGQALQGSSNASVTKLHSLGIREGFKCILRGTISTHHWCGENAINRTNINYSPPPLIAERRYNLICQLLQSKNIYLKLSSQVITDKSSTAPGIAMPALLTIAPIPEEIFVLNLIRNYQ